LNWTKGKKMDLKAKYEQLDAFNEQAELGGGK
jgi:hypothetical protein